MSDLLEKHRGGAAVHCAAAPEHWFPQITHFTAHKAFNLHTEQIHSWDFGRTPAHMCVSGSKTLDLIMMIRPSPKVIQCVIIKVKSVI